MSDKAVKEIIFNIDVCGASYLFFDLKGLAIAFLVGAILTVIVEVGRAIAKEVL